MNGNMDRYWLFGLVLVAVSTFAEEVSDNKQEIVPQAFSYSHVIHDHGPSVRHQVAAEGEERTYGEERTHGHDAIVQTINKPVPYAVLQPYAVTEEKHVPYAVRVPVAVPVDRPYLVHVAKPYAVPVQRPYPVAVERPVPYPVKYPVKVSVPAPIPVAVPQPYPVFIHGHGSLHHYEQPHYVDGGLAADQPVSAEKEEEHS